MLIPSLTVDDLEASAGFFVRFLAFTIETRWPVEEPFFASLLRGTDELHLSRRQPGRHDRAHVTILVDDVDALFAAMVAQGFVPPDRAESPVHCAPLDQSWGTREFYVDEPGGNTVVLQQR